MAVISASDLGGDEDLARRVLASARSVAPIDTIRDSEDRKTAIAILKAIAKDVAARGSRFVKSERAGQRSADYAVDAAWFSDEDRDSLRALCSVQNGAGIGPVGSFPIDRPVRRLWPERYAP